MPLFRGRSVDLKPALWALAVVLWIAGAAAGMYQVWVYDNAPGSAATPPERWSGPETVPTGGRPTLVLLAHPQCSCTRATLTELAEVLARVERRPQTYVYFLKPFGFPEGWEHSDLWRTASALPDVTVIRDDDGEQARKLGAATSGQVLLYDADGSLLFAGGITASRAHVGENAGRSALVALLNSGAAAPGSTTPVFGCSLFGPDAEQS